MRTAQKALLQAVMASLLLCAASGWSAVRGRALLIDAPDRGKPGDLILCLINGEERKLETLVKGQVIDARFSPDGKKIVYGMAGTIKTMDLKTRTSQDICPYTAGFTYFNWCRDNRVYWSDGVDKREIFSVDLATKKKVLVHKGNKGRATVSLDGKRAAWVIPPVCATVGSKQYRYMGGCGGSISPSGKYLTSNLTTSHKLMGIFAFGSEGPGEKPMASVTAPDKYAFNGFFFGRTDDWVCYVLEHPKNVSPTSYICYWRTNDHIRVSDFGKLCIKDYFDETDVVPANAKLQKITICSDGPTNTPLEHTTTNVGVKRSLKVVGHYTLNGQRFEPQLREGVTWKVDGAKLAMTGSSYEGKSESSRVTVTAEYKGKRDTFQVTVLPKLTGDGFKAEYFSDATLTKCALTRTDAYIDFRWTGRSSPDKSINGRKPWSVQWTGKLNVQTAGAYTFYFLQAEGNDRFLRGKDKTRKPCYGVWINDKLVITRVKKWNYPWAKPKPSVPINLSKGLHSVRVMTVDTAAHPVVAQLYWSGPGIKKSLLGGGYVHSGMSPAKKPVASLIGDPQRKHPATR